MKIAAGKPVPVALREPIIEEWDRPYWQAFAALQSERRDALSRIPWSGVAQYAQFYGFDDLEELCQIIWGIDDEYIRITKERLDAEAQAAANAHKQGNQGHDPSNHSSGAGPVGRPQWGETG